MDAKIQEIQDKLLDAIEQRQIYSIRKLHKKLAELKKKEKKYASKPFEYKR